MRRICIGLAALLLPAALAGCSLAPFGDKAEKAVVTVIDAAEQDRKGYNDQKADVLLKLPCDISIGAYYRLTNSVQQEALTMLCSGKRPGEPDPSLAGLPGAPGGALTVDELVRMAETVRPLAAP